MCKALIVRSQSLPTIFNIPLNRMVLLPCEAQTRCWKAIALLVLASFFFRKESLVDFADGTEYAYYMLRAPGGLNDDHQRIVNVVSPCLNYNNIWISAFLSTSG